MKAQKSLLILILLGFVVLLSSCEPPTYILYIDKEGCCAKDITQGSSTDPLANRVEDLVVFKGDRVVWINTAEETMTVKFTDEEIFGVTMVTIEPLHREILTVQSRGENGRMDYVVTPCHGGSGSPKTRVGEDP